HNRLETQCPSSASALPCSKRQEPFAPPAYLSQVQYFSHSFPCQENYVQPSGADRASVVDVPATHQDDSHFALGADMLGLKLELPQREDGVSKKTRPIYLDMQATTPVDPRVLDAMLPYLTDQYGNPHSRTHAYGWEAEKGVEDARKHIADLIGANPKDIIFTFGATETNNMAIKGVARFHKNKRHVITTQTEEGFDVTYLPVQRNGIISLEELESAIRPDTSLISIMAVNNETGVIQPIKEIGAIAHQYCGIYFHTDAAQAAGKIPLDVNAMNPILSGGGQERGLRSGTLPAALAVGMDHAWGINEKVERVVRNGDPDGYPGCVNLSFAYVEGESLLMALKDIALSSGSACTSASLEPSYVFRALGAAEYMAHSVLRFGIGRFTSGKTGPVCRHCLIL
ncbi:pyridoxal phosphate-dependent transferase, partial [Russula earlei]